VQRPKQQQQMQVQQQKTLQRLPVRAVTWALPAQKQTL
jgi:hypothetical protein